MKTHPHVTELPPADKTASYWWMIHLNPAHPDNSPNVPHLTGYSKMQNHDEAKDKRTMLQYKVVMLATRGYLKKSLRIEFYAKQKTDLLIDKTNSLLLFTLYPDTFKLEPQYIKYFDWVTFLNNFYRLIKNGEDVSYLLPKRKATFSKDDYFDIDKVRCTSIGQLQTYCSKLTRNGHAFGQVNNFYTKYKEKYFPND